MPDIPADENSRQVRQALSLLLEAIERLRDARDLMDEAAEALPDTAVSLAASLSAYESVIEALRQPLKAIAEWTDTKAELEYSRHSPLNLSERKPR